MYISKIHIQGFRNFKDKEILFNDGVNVIIGHNNAGKTNLIKAIALVIDSQTSKRLQIDDFNKNVNLQELQNSPPKISIALSITESKDEDKYSDDLVTVGNWLTKLEQPYEALLTYELFLPERKFDDYKSLLAEAENVKKAWLIIKHNFIRLYIHKIFGGESRLQNIADTDCLQKFDFQFLDAIRDVERDMFSGRNTLLKEVLHFFMDYDIKKDHNKDDDVKTLELRTEIKKRQEEFSTHANTLLGNLQVRMNEGKEQILIYAKETGASFHKANPDFEGSLSEVELFSALQLIVKYEAGIDIQIPVTHNGLGYNNLIYMSLLLAKMQVDSDGNYLDSNAKVFPVLAIEEPEAHLHPAMQYKFLKFLRGNQVKKKVRQIFVTTHSTQITSAVSLDEIICLHDESGILTVGYPSKVFPDNEDGKKSEAYVKRFLDATKSDMLFAQRVILVEGIAEQLLFPILAKYLQKSLEDNHIVVINVGGRCFKHFLYLFDSNENYSIPKRIVCITDRDPERKEKNKKNSKYKACYPFEYKQDDSKYDYKDNATVKIDKYRLHSNIRFFSQDAERGKTFEYDLALYNPSLNLLLTDSITNKDDITKLMQIHSDRASVFADYLKELEGSDIEEIINANIYWEEEDKKKGIIASLYLDSLDKRKGEHALELAYALEKNLEKQGNDDFQDFVVPDYIREAIEWICQ